MKSLLSVILLTALLSCNTKSNEIVINGNIKGLKSEWVYLYSAYVENPTRAKPPIDSARVINGVFNFHIKPDTAFQTQLVGLVYKGTRRYKDKELPMSVSLGINDPHAPKDGKPHMFGDFLLETGTTELTGDLTKSEGIEMKAGPQNKFYLDNFDMPFIRISTDPAKHKGQVDRFIKKVQALPNAYWALFALKSLKYEVTNDELKQMYNAFDEETRKSQRGRQIKEFLDTRPDEKALRPNNLLTTADGRHIPMIDTTKKLNMIVLWESWCGPCRQEIPSLKKIAANIKDDRFRLVSVSIDDDKDRWKKALGEEQMTWQQLSIDSAIMERVKTQYNLNYIPQIFFIDGKRNLLTKLGGFEPENEEKITAIINRYLK
ncbi:MAG: thioredoxin-like domain-containing protein [Bacteroidota bacterium]